MTEAPANGSRPVPDAARRARRAVAAAFVVHGAASGTWAARLPWVQQHLQLSAPELGVALVGAPVGALLALAFGGRVVDRFGSAPVTRTTLLGVCASLPLPALAPGLAPLFAALMIFGAAAAVMDVAMNAHGVAVEARYGRRVLSSFHGMWSLGSMVGALGGAAMASADVGAPRHFALVAALLAVLGAVLLLALLPADEDRRRGARSADEFTSGAPDGACPGTCQGAEPDDGRTGRRGRPSRRLLGLGLLALCALFAEGAAADWTAVWFTTDLGAGEAGGALAFAAFSVAMTAGRFAGDRLVGAVGPVRFVRISGALAAAGLAAGLLAGDPRAAAAGVVLLGLGLSCLVPVVYGAAARSGGSAGGGIAMVAALSYPGWLIGPPVIGALAGQTSLRLALFAVVAAAAAPALLARTVSSPAPVRT